MCYGIGVGRHPLMPSTPPTKSSESATPPYVPYATFISALDALRSHGIPASGRIDKTIWESQSGSIRGQLILAFKFLGLIDDNNRVLPALPPLVTAATPVDRKPLLKKLIEEKYREVIALNLLTISPGQLDDAFRKLGISGSTLKTATRFFIKACSELGIPIAQRFSERTRATGPRGPRKKKAASLPNKPNGQDHGYVANSSWEEQLLSKFPSFDPAWNDELKAKWFAGFERLMGAKPE
jgi:hypothetical protein